MPTRQENHTNRINAFLERRQTIETRRGKIAQLQQKISTYFCSIPYQSQAGLIQDFHPELLKIKRKGAEVDTTKLSAKVAEKHALITEDYRREHYVYLLTNLAEAAYEHLNDRLGSATTAKVYNHLQPYIVHARDTLKQKDSKAARFLSDTIKRIEEFDTLEHESVSYQPEYKKLCRLTKDTPSNLAAKRAR